jgi:hypothetical protein
MCGCRCRCGVGAVGLQLCLWLQLWFGCRCQCIQQLKVKHFSPGTSPPSSIGILCSIVVGILNASFILL